MNDEDVREKNLTCYLGKLAGSLKGGFEASSVQPMLDMLERYSSDVPCVDKGRMETAIELFLFRTLRVLNNELMSVPDWSKLQDLKRIDMWIQVLFIVHNVHVKSSVKLGKSQLHELDTSIKMIYEMGRLPANASPLAFERWGSLPSMLLIARDEVDCVTTLAMILDSILHLVDHVMTNARTMQGQFDCLDVVRAVAKRLSSMEKWQTLELDDLWKSIRLVEMAIRKMACIMLLEKAALSRHPLSGAIFDRLCADVIKVAIDTLSNIVARVSATKSVPDTFKQPHVNRVFGLCRTVFKAVTALNLQQSSMFLETLLKTFETVCRHRECWKWMKLHLINFGLTNECDQQPRMVLDIGGKQVDVNHFIFTRMYDLPMCGNAKCLNMEGRREFTRRPFDWSSGRNKVWYCSRSCKVQEQERSLCPELLSAVQRTPEPTASASRLFDASSGIKFPRALIWCPLSLTRKQSRRCFPGSVMAITLKVVLLDITLLAEVVTMPDDIIVDRVKETLNTNVKMTLDSQSTVVVDPRDTAAKLGLVDGQYLYVVGAYVRDDRECMYDRGL